MVHDTVNIVFQEINNIESLMEVQSNSQLFTMYEASWSVVTPITGKQRI